MEYAFPLDPGEVLGVPPGATMEQIREAYRAKSKRHHPDVGGDEWAFRVVARSYELLCTARVMGRASAEMAGAGAAGAARAAGGARADRQVRTGVQDPGPSPERVVGVEMLLIRYDLDGAAALLLERPEERNLSCTLNVAWPRPGIGPVAPAEAEAIRRDLDRAFRQAARATGPIGSSGEWDEAGRFAGWLSFPTAVKADEAFHMLHRLLKQHRLGVMETIRDVTIPREG